MPEPVQEAVTNTEQHEKPNTGDPKTPEEAPKAPETPENNGEKQADFTGASLEDLKKSNPEIAKLVKESEDTKAKLDEITKASEDADKKKKAEQGKWQELHEDSEKKREEAEKLTAQHKSTLEKFKGTINSILDEVKKTIPEENQSLIPDEFSERQQLEYIVKHAEHLGATVAVNKGANVPKNEEDHPQDEEGKVTQEYDELLKKVQDGSSTRIDQNKLLELGDKLKEIQSRKTQ